MTTARPGTFLLVDDSPLTHQMYRLVFSRGALAGSTLLHAMNGREGYGLLAAHPEITLVLLDLNMPEMNGLEFLERRAGRGAAPGGAGRAGDHREHARGRGARARRRRHRLSPQAVRSRRSRAAGRATPAGPARGLSDGPRPRLRRAHPRIHRGVPAARGGSDGGAARGRTPVARRLPRRRRPRRAEGPAPHAQGQLRDDGASPDADGGARARGPVRAPDRRARRAERRGRGAAGRGWRAAQRSDPRGPGKRRRHLRRGLRRAGARCRRVAPGIAAASRPRRFVSSAAARTAGRPPMPAARSGWTSASSTRCSRSSARR